jgi:hypothetical protein
MGTNREQHSSESRSKQASNAVHSKSNKSGSSACCGHAFRRGCAKSQGKEPVVLLE